MPSEPTRAILANVHNLLYSIINTRGPDTIKSTIAKQVEVAKLQFKTWEDCYKLEADRPQFAYSNLLDSDKELESKTKWYFSLLDAWLAEQEQGL